MKMSRVGAISICLQALFLAGLSACSGGGSDFPWQKTPIQTASPIIDSTPTPIPPKELTICLNEEPSSLYIYAEKQSKAMWRVLESIYDGPSDKGAGEYKAVILQKMPSFDDGDMILESIPVVSGDLVLDADNHIVALESGVNILPSGCKDSSCSITWDGISEVYMDQVAATFKLRNNLLWSDGTPLTTVDSLFSFNIASDHKTASESWRVDLTFSYEILDDTTIRWKGLPGYQGLETLGMFWIPLPEHLLGNLPVSDLVTSDLAARYPVGWGPYVIKEWVSGDHIRLEKNRNYFRAEEGLPVFDRLIYRFIDSSSGASTAALASGLCDLVEQSFDTKPDQMLVGDLLNSSGALAEWRTGPEIIQLAMGIKPSAYDNGFTPLVDRANYFGNPATRLALASCVDSERLNEEVYAGRADQASVADLLGNQSWAAATALISYDREAGKKLLHQAGWMDMDNDSTTPRQAVNISGVADGTPLSLSLLVTPDNTSMALAEGITKSFADCGINVNTITHPFSELYSAGPDGLVFGRGFDLVLISWQYSQTPGCYLYTTAQIPGNENYWIGGNVTGYSNQAFDVTCSGLIRAMPGDANWELLLQEAVRLFSSDLPTIPLFKPPKLLLARPDFCVFDFNTFGRSDLTEIELFDFGSECRSY